MDGIPPTYVVHRMHFCNTLARLAVYRAGIWTASTQVHLHKTLLGPHESSLDNNSRRF